MHHDVKWYCTSGVRAVILNLIKFDCLRVCRCPYQNKARDVNCVFIVLGLEVWNVATWHTHSKANVNALFVLFIPQLLEFCDVKEYLQQCCSVLLSLLKLNPVAQQKQTFHISVNLTPAPATLTRTGTLCYCNFVSNVELYSWRVALSFSPYLDIHYTSSNLYCDNYQCWMGRVLNKQSSSLLL